MLTASYLILYVADPLASAAFYERLLGRPPVEQSPTFALLPLGEGLMLGLWKRDSVVPVPEAAPGSAEIALTVPTAADVDAHFAKWREAQVAIALPPTDLDFGRTFLALDPDGHRLRVHAPIVAG